MAFARPRSDDHRRGGQTINLHCAAGLLNIFIYYFSISYIVSALLIRAWWSIITGAIKHIYIYIYLSIYIYLYNFSRTSVGAPWHPLSRIKSRIRFRGEGKSDTEKAIVLGLRFMVVYSSLHSASRRARHNLRYRKIDVVDSPAIRATFVTARVSFCLHRRNMEILFPFLSLSVNIYIRTRKKLYTQLGKIAHSTNAPRV